MKCYGHKQKRVVHASTKNPCAENGTAENWKVFESVEMAVKDGYRLCPECKFK